MTRAIEIREVSGQKLWREFFNLPRKIYKDDPTWVPPLMYDLKRTLNEKRNPFFREAEAKYWLAYKDGECAGRISAVVNHQHNKFHNEHAGFYGYFECIDDHLVCSSLFDTARTWLSEKGMKFFRGPVNLSLTNESGLLIDGFDRPPNLQMNYNPPYYIRLLEKYGFEKEHDLLAFYIEEEIIRNERVMHRLKRISDLVKKRENICFRYFNTSDYKNEVERMRLLFNDYMSDNWGFLPIDKIEFDFLAESLKPVLIKELAIFAEVDGEAVAFSLALPDINQLVKRIDGKLFPFGIFKFLYYKNSVTDIRVMLMGIKKTFRKRGLEAFFYHQTIVEAVKRKFKGAELSWISEANPIMIREIENLDGRLYKRYRVYRKELDSVELN